jgi:hypothetical protein
MVTMMSVTHPVLAMGYKTFRKRGTEPVFHASLCDEDRSAERLLKPGDTDRTESGASYRDSVRSARKPNEQVCCGLCYHQVYG